MDFLLDARKHYPTIHKGDIRVIVLEALPMILPGFNEKLAEFSKQKMIERGIDIRLRTAVTSFDGTEVTIKSLDENPKDPMDESKIVVIRTKTLIWTAGVTPAVQINVLVLITTIFDSSIGSFGFSSNDFIVTSVPSKLVTAVLSLISIPRSIIFCFENSANFSLKPGRIIGRASKTITRISPL